MHSSLLLSFRPDITFTEIAPDEWLLLSPRERLSLRQLTGTLIETIRRMVTPGICELDMANEILQAGGPVELSKFYYYLQVFTAKRMICYTIKDNECLFATIVPFSPYFYFKEQELQLEQAYRLSRFTSCRVENQKLLLESPLGHCRLILNDSRPAGLFAEFCTPTVISDFIERNNTFATETLIQFVTFLLNANLISPIDKDGDIDEDTNPALAQWEFHDLLFHTRTRLGRHQNPYGGTYRFANAISPLPAIKPRRTEAPTIDLSKPDIEYLKKSDTTFTTVLEERTSIRDHGPLPLTAQQLGEFLYRAARVKSLFQDKHQELTRRPYPAGGAICELEIYLAIQQCADLTPGLYHYDPSKHQLEQYVVLTPAVEQLLANAAMTAQVSRVQILVIITARFQRVSWKYQSMAYALILKNVGVLYQTMYLVATAMGLASCALGGSDADLFAHAANIEYLEESSVGEFILGAR